MYSCMCMYIHNTYVASLYEAGAELMFVDEESAR
jgi:hypothetical protein